MGLGLWVWGKLDVQSLPQGAYRYKVATSVVSTC